MSSRCRLARLESVSVVGVEVVEHGAGQAAFEAAQCLGLGIAGVGSNNNHGGCLLHCEVTVGQAGGHISVGATPRSYQVTPAGPSHLMPTQRVNANPKGSTEPTSQTPGDQDPTTAKRGTSP